MLGSAPVPEAPAASEPSVPSSPSTVAPPDSPVDGTLGGEPMATAGVPVFAPEAPQPPAIDARAWLICDAESGEILAALSPHVPRPPASTIKLLTAIITAPALDPDDEYVATDDDAAVEGSRVGLTPSQTYTGEDLLHGLMLASGNDAAHALADVAGGQDATVEMMNDEARRLGAFDTVVHTPHGLNTPGQLSSAYDLALIGRASLQNERITDLAGTADYDFPGQGGDSFLIENQNRLLGTYDGTVGLKTGYTSRAGHSFVGAVERDGRTLIAVVLGAEERAETGAAALFDWAFRVGGVEPVGHLVTPDDVESMTRQAEQDGNVFGRNPLEDYSDVLGTPGGTADAVPPVVWLSLVAAAAAGGLGFALRRRSPRHPK